MSSLLVYNENAIVEVTKEFTFDSCHQLLQYKGACERLHGHTYKLQVTVQGKVDHRGIVVDFKDVKKKVNELIVDRLDHYNLNDKMTFNTTAENMVVYFYDLLEIYFNELSEQEGRYITLREIKLWETPTSFATYRGVETNC